MSSFEFQYARLTAQSPGCDPNKVQGNKPEFEPAFLAQCAGRIKPRPVYHAAMSIYCEDEVSMDELNLGMANWGWKHVQARHPCRAYKALEVARVAELATLMYLYPWQEEGRSARQCAAWVRVSRQTWAAKYSLLRDEITYELQQMKSDADTKLSKIMLEHREEID